VQSKRNVDPSAEAWIVTNGAPGMEAQGVAVVQATGMPFKLKKVHVSGPLAWLPSRLQILLPPQLFLRFVSASEPLGPPWPRLVVSVGRQSVAPALAIKRLSNQATFAVHVQDPKVAASNFDWIAAPKHDGFIGPNVTTTLGAVHGITPSRLAEAKERFATAISRLPHPRIAVLLGGNSRAFRFTAADAAKFGLSLTRMALENNGSLLVTPSARTPREAIDALQRAILKVPHLIWDGTGENPYLAFLGFADAIVVTGDSVNMVTEAAGTGKPVYVESLRGGSRRIAQFHALMNEAGATRPFTGRLDDWSYVPVNDTDMVAAVIRRALGIEKSKGG
jgi:mitochondrial fission protein ELM1